MAFLPNIDADLDKVKDAREDFSKLVNELNKRYNELMIALRDFLPALLCVFPGVDSKVKRQLDFQAGRITVRIDGEPIDTKENCAVYRTECAHLFPCVPLDLAKKYWKDDVQLGLMCKTFEKSLDHLGRG